MSFGHCTQHPLLMALMEFKLRLDGQLISTTMFVDKTPNILLLETDVYSVISLTAPLRNGKIPPGVKAIGILS